MHDRVIIWQRWRRRAPVEPHVTRVCMCVCIRTLIVLYHITVNVMLSIYNLHSRGLLNVIKATQGICTKTDSQYLMLNERIPGELYTEIGLENVHLNPMWFRVSWCTIH